MSDTKLAKGPWVLRDGYYPGFIEIDCGESMQISVVTSATDISFEQHNERTSNAHLIAAAPELYEALDAVKRSSPQWLISIANNECKAGEAVALAKMYNNICLVLAKARGES